MIKSIEIKAPAKINIGLNIVEKRNDGFHNLETIFYPITDMFDRIFIKHSESFEFICDNESISDPADNLIVKAKNLLEETTGKTINATIKLKKVIPMGAGLGGGSSDAAAVLISLNDMFRLNLKYDKLLELALSLGSDVPFFLRAKPSIGKSRGEILKMIPLDIESPILLVNPGIHISTKEAFGNITPKKSPTDYEALDYGENGVKVTMFSEFFKNDFEEYVFSVYPEIKEIKETMLNCGADFSLMSGTGSTVYGIFPDLESAQKAYNNMNEDYFRFISHP